MRNTPPVTTAHLSRGICFSEPAAPETPPMFLHEMEEVGNRGMNLRLLWMYLLNGAHPRLNDQK